MAFTYKIWLKLCELRQFRSVLIQANLLSHSRYSKLSSATTKIDTAERSKSIGRESLPVCLGNRCHSESAGLAARGQSSWNMMRIGDKKTFCLGICQNWQWVNHDDATEVSDQAPHKTTYQQNNSRYKKFQQSGCLCTVKQTAGQTILPCRGNCYQYQLPEPAATMANATITGRQRGFHFRTRQSPATLPFWHLCSPQC
jgi:hypothetical protein